MGFYFPNIDKPKCCAECPCIDEGNTGLEPYCPILKTIIYDVNAIHKDCIMVETKSPHGRLIDADALANKYERLHKTLKGSNHTTDKVRRDEIDMFLFELKCNAPTIIEAEGKGK